VSWIGEISSFQLDTTQKNWVMGVDYYDDLNPTQRINQSLTMPVTTSRADAVTLIQSKGKEIRGIYSLKESDVVGMKIAIP
jgi:hypothetical protein